VLLSDAFSTSFGWQGKGSPSHSQLIATDTIATRLESANTKFHADTDRDDVYTVQILMSDTGGGHRASADALEDALESLYPGKFECDIVDIYTEYGPFWPFNDAVQIYKLMAEYSWTWDLFYQFGETEFGYELNKLMLNAFCYEPFKNCMTRTFDSTQKRADIVISVHPLCQDLPLKILSDLDASSGGNCGGDGHREHSNQATPFVTVVTDLGGAHKTWFNPGVDKCFVPSDVLNEKAKSRGLSASSQIVQYGLPIRKGFWPEQISNRGASSTPQTLDAMRQQLDIDNIPTVLVVGGGDGMGGIVDIASTLGKTLGDQRTSEDDNPQYQMVVVCGNNQEAQQKLRKMNWPGGVKVIVQGFVSNMDEWMKASDCLVTKAGPGTIAEASICGLPCLLFAYLPGQEAGNIPFVEESGFGKYSSDPKEIADSVSLWLKSPEKMQAMKQAALSAARPSATLDIAQELAEIAFSTKKEGEAVVTVQ